jgi:hypothetical protein
VDMDYDNYYTSAKTASFKATFPITIGYKNDDHNNLERIIAQDLKNMARNRTLCFVGSSNGQPYKEVACVDCYQVMQGYNSKTPTQITWKRECSICCNWMVRGMLYPM